MWDASCGRPVRRPLNFLARQRLRWNGANDSYCCDYLAALHWRKWWQNKLASCDYLCSGWEPSHPYGPADNGSFIWDSHWPLATGIITGWAGSYTEARLEQQLKSSLSHRPVPALRIGGVGGGGWVLPWRLGKGYLFGGSVCPASVAPVRHRLLRPTRQPLRGNYIRAKEVAL